MDFNEKTITSQEIFTGKIIKVRLDTVQLPDGGRSTREIVEHQGAVAILALDEDKNIWMVKQFRKPLEKVLLEIPAGTMEKGENPLACAARELEEETGLKAARWDKVLSYYSAPGFCNEYLHIYLARELSPGKVNLDPDEFVEPLKIPLQEAYRKIFTGDLIDGKSIIAIQYVIQKYGEGSL
ncbi:NUDIX domain-containing protein [Syntrophomonas erecta]